MDLHWSGPVVCARIAWACGWYVRLSRVLRPAWAGGGRGYLLTIGYGRGGFGIGAAA